jgi:hypothetical protein
MGTDAGKGDKTIAGVKDNDVVNDCRATCRSKAAEVVIIQVDGQGILRRISVPVIGLVILA